MPRCAAGFVLLAALVLAGCGAAGPPAAPPGPVPAPPNPTAAAYPHLVELQRIADGHGGNRALGTPGYDASVDYVTGVLRAAGYEVSTPEFTVRRFTVRAERLTAAGAPVRAGSLGYSPSTGPAGITGPLAVTAGQGCAAAALAGVPARSIVLVRRGACPFSQKAAAAATAGAAGLVVVNSEDAPLRGTLGEQPVRAVPAMGVTKADGDALAARAGTPVTLLVDASVEQTGSRNVIARTRTGRAGKVVMAGAHLDSVPEGPGINDDGSGVAALLAAAQRLGAAAGSVNEVRFGFWGAEEVGLVGSTDYVTGLPPAERARLAVYLNLDMVASPNSGYYVQDGDDSDHRGAGPGPPGSAVVERALVEALTAVGVAASGTDFDGRSDYQAFIDAKVPSGGLFTGGEEVMTADQATRWGGRAGVPNDRCYHQRCDRLETIDQTALTRNTDAVTAVLGRFARSTAELGS